MHSRIYQITSTPIEEADYISESDFYEHWFTNSIADYVDGDTDRAADIQCLRARLSDIAFIDVDDSFVILPRGKEIYFTKAYEAFLTARNEIMNMSLTEFAGDGFSESMHRMQNAFCDEFSFYVSSDEFRTIPFDEFIRYAEIGTRYYIGATLDYHF